MSDRERIIARLTKIKALAKNGVGGERENAEKLLAEVAAKYGVDLDSLDDGSEEERKHPVEVKKGWRRQLLCQLLALMRIEQYGDVESDHCALYSRRIGKRVLGYYILCTEMQWVELMAKYVVLERDYEAQLEVFFRAFLSANDLLAPCRPDSKPTPEQIEKDLMATRMSVGIKKSVLQKQIEGATA